MSRSTYTLGCITAMLAATTGCTTTEAHRTSVTDKLDAVTIQGTFSLPNVGVVPVDLRIIRKGQDTFEEDSTSRTNLDMPPFLSGSSGGAGGFLAGLVPGGSALVAILSLITGAAGAEANTRRRRKKEMPALERRQQILAEAEPVEAKKIKAAWDSAT